MISQRQPKYLQKLLAKQIKERRTALEISQEDLADRCGLHRTYLGSVERGERNVTLATLEQLARGLDCEPADLIR